VDTANNELLVVNQVTNSVTVYARTASGNVAPLRTLSGAATGLSNPIGLAVDTVNNELAVGNFGQRLRYGLRPDGQWECGSAADPLRGRHRVK